MFENLLTEKHLRTWLPEFSLLLQSLEQQPSTADSLTLGSASTHARSGYVPILSFPTSVIPRHYPL